MGSYWYKKIVYYCPYCSYRYAKRKRVYGKRPKEAIDRVERIRVYDFMCGGKKNEC